MTNTEITYNLILENPNITKQEIQEIRKYKYIQQVNVDLKNILKIFNINPSNYPNLYKHTRNEIQCNTIKPTYSIDPYPEQLLPNPKNCRSIDYPILRDLLKYAEYIKNDYPEELEDLKNQLNNLNLQIQKF